jgi:hypothetical protein
MFEPPETVLHEADRQIRNDCGIGNETHSQMVSESISREPCGVGASKAMENSTGQWIPFPLCSQ